MESVEEYIDFIFDKLNKIAIEDISYSDYDQMADWLGEIRKQVKRLEKKQVPMEPINDNCGDCGVDIRNWAGDEPFDYCPYCGQAIDWSDGVEND